MFLCYSIRSGGRGQVVRQRIVASLFAGSIPVVRPPTKKLKRATGIEPVSLAWKAKVLPLYDARNIINKVTRESLFVNKLHSK